MALTITLLESTPHRLRYLAVDDGDDTVGFTAGTIPNAGAAGSTPDLRIDSFLDSDTPMNSLVSTPVTNQAGARKLLNGEGLTAPADIDTPRAHLKIIPRQSEVAGWGVDADLGTGLSAGFAVILIQAPAVQNAAAIIDITFAHTENR